MDTKINTDKVVAFGESTIYIVTIIFLFVSAILLIIDEISTITQYVSQSAGIKIIVGIISETLLLLMIIEILTTVRMSIKNHTLCAEPFLMVGLIASIRRILVISVETAYVHEYFESFMIEMGLLIVVIFIFVVSIVLLRKHKNIT